jgi:very-short-patch-repair endonuclease
VPEGRGGFYLLSFSLQLTFFCKLNPKNHPAINGTPPLEGNVKKANRMENNREITAYINTQPIYRNFIENLPYNIKLKARSRALRKAGVLSEVIFWLQVHKGMFWKIDFDRQRIIGNFIVDFYVKTLGLVVEIDGSSHDNKEEYDQKREDYLVSLGLKVYRISDLRVKHDLNNVMMELKKYIATEFRNKVGNVW